MNRSAAVIGWGKSGQGAAGALLARDWSVRAYASRATASLSFDDVADVPVHVEEDANALAAAVLDARPDLITRSSPRASRRALTCGARWSSPGASRRKAPTRGARG